jgi:hypothetical protein
MGPLQTWLVEHDPLPIVELTDPVIDKVGFPTGHAYVEIYWLPIIGPSALWALRRIGGWLSDSPDGFDMPHAPFAGELGLGSPNGRHSPMICTLARLVVFEMAVVTPQDALAVRRFAPPVRRRLAIRLPGHLAARHDTDLQAATGLARTGAGR